ncbi:MAG: type II toxin-antitoxin system HicA family toxin [Saprospiraceae bacterium]|nr:type II toxin-antitoxin system HicA family toxin [Saprospiraceae bacterium]
MSKSDKILQKILSGLSDKNIAFSDLIIILSKFGFALRTNGSHHILTREDVEEIINIQPKNGQAKPYQVKQVRELIVKYGLNIDTNE